MIQVNDLVSSSFAKMTGTTVLTFFHTLLNTYRTKNHDNTTIWLGVNWRLLIVFVLTIYMTFYLIPGCSVGWYLVSYAVHDTDRSGNIFYYHSCKNIIDGEDGHENHHVWISVCKLFVYKGTVLCRTILYYFY